MFRGQAIAAVFGLLFLRCELRGIYQVGIRLAPQPTTLVCTEHPTQAGHAGARSHNCSRDIEIIYHY